MPATDLVIRRPEGLYCPPGDFYIDPLRAVRRAVITHAHADHARAGHGQVLTAQRGVKVLKARFPGLPLQGLAWGEKVQQDGVCISLHPAGHVLGAAQVRLEHAGQVWVVSGDYFLSARGDCNPTCEPFESVPCQVFVTESTFAMPLYRWPAQAQVLGQINAWWQANAAQGIPSVLQAYSFGKSQRLLAGVDAGIGPMFVHRSVQHMNQACAAAGMVLPATHLLHRDVPPRELGRALVLMPASADADWPSGAAAPMRAQASGWMQLAQQRASRGGQRGFVLSDHADWPGLLLAIQASGAARVIVHHGQTAALVRWLCEQGLDAHTFAAAMPPGPADKVVASTSPPWSNAGHEPE